MTLSLRNLALAAMAAACLTTSSARADVISTIGSWDGSTSIGTWGSVGSGGTPTYGETFTATAANSTLQSMLFEIQTTASDPILFNAYVYQWDGTNITGPALFTSPLQTVPTGSGFQAISVSTGNLALTPGQQYIAMYSTIGDAGSLSATGAWGGRLPDSTYPDGTFEYNNASSFGAMTSSNWNVSGGFGDLAFTLTFASPAAVPEPSTWALITVSAAFLGGKTLLRRRRPTTNSAS
jgi:hypothetical protein